MDSHYQVLLVSATRIALFLVFLGLAPARAFAEEVTPPVVKTHVDATVPRNAKRVHADVVLIVTVDAQGRVDRVEVSESGGADLDEAAIQAVRQWTFEPAHRGDRAIAARIRIPFHFAPEPLTQAPLVPNGDKSIGGGVSGGTSVPHAELAAEPEEVTVEGEAKRAPRGASDIKLDERILRAAPHRDAGELLRTAPGVYVARVEGEAAAQKIYLRGFDADHGQDVELRVGGIPINQLSHVHGQGYADLNFVIPEIVRSLRVVEGVYDARQGDFAVAGTAEFDLGVREREHRLSYSLGTFGTQRALGIFAPKKESDETFGAAQFRSSDGFGPDVRGSTSGGAVAQYRVSLSRSSHLTVHGAAYAARASSAGVLRRDDIQRSYVGFYDAYPDATARSQSTEGTRTQLGVRFEKKGERGARTSAQLYGTATTYRSRNNFTGYIERSRVEPTWIGRGDLVEQSNDDVGLGLLAAHHTAQAKLFPFLSADVEIGGEGKANRISQAQNLLRAPENETWDQRSDADIRAMDVGAYIDGHLTFPERVRLRAGARADLLAFDIDDKLGNFIPKAAAKTHLVGYRRTAAGTVVSPRASLEWEAKRWLTVQVAYGQGFRSPHALTLGEGEKAPFAKVHSYEAGATWKPLPDMSVTAAIYETKLSYDLAFDAAEARMERIGPTTRTGFSLRTDLRPTPWFTLGASATYVRARLDDPPAATPEHPNPMYQRGELLPNVPPLVVRADLSVDRELKIAKRLFRLRAGYGLSFLSDRPLPYGESSPSVFFVDAQASVRHDFVELGLQGTNLLDATYAATEYTFVSNWKATGTPSYVPARHIVAGPPRMFLGTITLYL